MCSTEQNVLSATSTSYTAVTATAVNAQQIGQRPPWKQRKAAAKPPTSTQPNIAKTAKPSEAAKDAGSQGLRTRESRKVAVVPGKRAIWGTLPFVTSSTVKSAIHNVLSVPHDSITVKRKSKTLRAKQCWWFVITGAEEVMMSMEANWNRKTLQTGWKLQPCFVPLRDWKAEDNDPAHVTKNEDVNNATDSTSAAAICISDSGNPGSTGSDQANAKDAPPAINSGSTDNATPSTSEFLHGND